LRKVIDLSQSTALSGINVLGDGVRTLYDTDGDVFVTNISADTVYVNTAWAGSAIGAEVTLADSSTAVYGVNAFSSVKAATDVAIANAGATVTIEKLDVSELAVKSEFTTAGTYTLLGGTLTDQPSTRLHLNATGVNVVIGRDLEEGETAPTAIITLGKVRAGKNDSGTYTNNSLTVKNAIVGAVATDGAGGGWWTFYDSSLTITNSLVGVWPSASFYSDVRDMPRGAAGTTVYAPYGSNLMGQNLGTVRDITITDSTVATGFFSVYDRGYAELDNALIYLGGGLIVGKNSTESDGNLAWGANSSPEDYRVGETATVTLENGTIIRNIGYGDGGAGYGLRIGGDTYGGIVNVTDGSKLLMNASAANRANEDIYVYSTGVLNIEDGEVSGRNLTNAGTITVTDSTLTATGAVTNSGTITITGASDIAAASSGTDSGVIYLTSAQLDSDTAITGSGATIRVASGTDNMIDGSTLAVNFFQVGNGRGEETVIDRENDVSVTLRNGAALSVRGDAYHGWVGTEYANRENIGDNRYTLNIEDSAASFGYLHISTDGILNVSGNVTDETKKITNAGTSVDFYAGDFIVNGEAAFTGGTNAWIKYFKVSCDNTSATAPGTVTVEDGADLELSIHNGGHTGTSLNIYNHGVLNVDNATVRNNNVMTVSGELNLNNGASFTTAGASTNNGAINIVGSTFTVASTGALTNTGTITIDSASLLTGTQLTNNGTITVDATGLAENTVKKVIDLSQSEALANVALSSTTPDTVTMLTGADGDVIVHNVSLDRLYVNSGWAEGYALGDEITLADSTKVYFGVNAFANIDDVFALYGDKEHSNTETTEVVLLSDVTASATGKRFFYSDVDVTFTAASDVTVDMRSYSRAYLMGYYPVVNCTGTPASTPNFTVGDHVTLVAKVLMAGQNVDTDDVDAQGDATRDAGAANVIVNGTLSAGQTYAAAFSTITTGTSGVITNPGSGDAMVILARGTVEVAGDGNHTLTQLSPNYISNQGGTLTLEDTVVSTGLIQLIASDHDLEYRAAHGTISADNTLFYSSNALNIADAQGVLTLTNGSLLDRTNGNGLAITNAGTINITVGSTMHGAAVTNTGSIVIDGTSMLTAATIDNSNGTITINAGAAFTGTALVIDITGTAGFDAANVTVTGASMFQNAEGDVFITDTTKDTLYVNSEWATVATGTLVTLKDGVSTAIVGVNAFANAADALAAKTSDTTGIVFESDSVSTAGYSTKLNGLTLTTDVASAEVILSGDASYGMVTGDLTIGENLTLSLDRLLHRGAGTTITVDGTLQTTGASYLYIGTLEISETGRLVGADGGTITLNNGAYTIHATGTGKADYTDATAQIKADALRVMTTGTIALEDSYAFANTLEIGASGSVTLDDSTLSVGDLTVGSTLEVTSGSDVKATTLTNNGTLNVNGGNLTAATAMTNDGEVTVSGASTVNVATLTGNAIRLIDGANVSASTIVGAVTTDGDVTLSGTDTFGATTINSGSTATVVSGATFRVADNGSLYGTLTNNGTFSVSEATEVNVDNTLTNNNEVSIADSDNVTIYRLTNNADGNVAITDSTVTISGGGTNDGTLTIDGSTLYVAGTSALTNNGTITVTDSTLRIGTVDLHSTVAGGKISFTNSTVDMRGGYFSMNNSAAEVYIDSTTITNCSQFQMGYGDNAAGKVTIVNGSSVTLSNSPTFKADAKQSITIDAMSTLKAQGISYYADGDKHTITVDAGNFTGGYKKVIDVDRFSGDFANVEIKNLAQGVNVVYGADGDISLIDIDASKIYVNTAWSGMSYMDEITEGGQAKAYYGINAFDNVVDALAAVGASTSEVVFESASTGSYDGDLDVCILNDVALTTGVAGGVTETLTTTDDFCFNTTKAASLAVNRPVVTIGEGVTLTANNCIYMGFYYAPTFVVDGALRAGSSLWIGAASYASGNSGQPQVTVSATGSLYGALQYVQHDDAQVTITGNATAGQASSDRTAQFTMPELVSIYSGTLTLNNTKAVTGAVDINNAYPSYITQGRTYNGSFVVLNNTVWEATGNLTLVTDGTNFTGAAGLTLTNGSTATFAGTASIQSAGTVTVNASTLSVTGAVTNAGTIAMDYTSALTAASYTQSGSGAITIDATGYTGGVYKVIDLSGASSLEGVVTISNLDPTKGTVLYGADGDVVIAGSVDKSTYYVDAAWSTKQLGDTVTIGDVTAYYGINAFSSFAAAITGIADETATIELESDVTESVLVPVTYFNHDVLVKTGSGVSTAAVTWDVTGNSSTAPDTDGMTYFLKDADTESAKLTFGEGVTLSVPHTSSSFGNATYFGYNTANGMKVQIDGQVNAYVFYNAFYTDLTVSATGKVTSTESFIVRSYATVTFNGEGNFTESAPQADLCYVSQQGGIVNLNDTVVDAGAWWEMWDRNNIGADNVVLNMDNSTIVGATFKGDGANAPDRGFHVNLTNGSEIKMTGAITNVGTISVTDSSISGASFAQTLNTNATLSLVNSTATLTGAVTNAGTIAMDYKSTIGFATMTNTGTITIDATGYTGGKYLILDSLNNDYTEDQYRALLGTSWDDRCFKVENGDLFYLDFSSSEVYVNSTYSETGDNDGHTWGVDAFSTFADATAINPAKITATVGGSYTGTTTFEGAVGDIEGGTFGGSVAAGVYVKTDSRNWVDNEADLSLTIASGTFSKTVVGGDFVDKGYCGRFGDISLTIEGGTFSSTVGGGMAYTPASNRGAAEVYGNVSLTIEGGTFNRRIYGGNISRNGYGARTLIEGNVTLTIDASTNAIAFSDNIVAGSFDDGAITGDASVVFKGDGANLTFTGAVIGGSGSTYYITDHATQKRTYVSYIDGSRSISFSGFTGDFGGDIRAFSDITFADESEINFVNTELNLSDIENWNIQYGSSAVGIIANDFTDDTLNIDVTGWDTASVASWDALTGAEQTAFTGWDAFDSVTIGGEAASFDGSKWASSSYELALEDDSDNSKKFVVSFKA